MLLNIGQKYNSYDFSGVGETVSELLFCKKNDFIINFSFDTMAKG
jgi:hypothetical protein